MRQCKHCPRQTLSTDSAREAVLLAREHRCESDMWIFDPDGNGKALDAYDWDGNLRKP